MLDPEGHKLKVTRNRASSKQHLIDNGVEFTEHNNGAHLIIRTDDGVINFWPGTGKWIDKRENCEGRCTNRGVFELLKRIRQCQSPKHNA